MRHVGPCADGVPGVVQNTNMARCGDNLSVGPTAALDLSKSETAEYKVSTEIRASLTM
jgi:hypothetical protein